MISLTATLLAAGSGCGPRIILVPPGTPVQLAEPARAKVLVWENGKVKSQNTVEIPAGWWALPPRPTTAPTIR